MANTVAQAALRLIDPSITLQNCYPQQFQKWRKARANVRLGVADAKVLCVGDSTVAGYLTSGTAYALNAWPAQTAKILNGMGLPAADGLAIPPATNQGSIPDNRWGQGGNWIRDYFGWTGGNGSGTGACYTGSSGNLSFSPTNTNYSYDRFNVWYVTFPSNGTISCTATGGSAAVANTNGSSGVTSVTASCGAAGTSNSVLITASIANCLVLGVEPWLSTTKRVRVGNAGVNASTTASWLADTTNPYDKPITAYAPDLSIICLGINDAGNGVSTATYIANLKTIIAQCQLSGDVALMTFSPSMGSAYTGNEAAYWQAILSLGLPVIDIYSRFSQTWQTSLMADALHPNDAGHFDIAQAAASLIFNV